MAAAGSRSGDGVAPSCRHGGEWPEGGPAARSRRATGRRLQFLHTPLVDGVIEPVRPGDPLAGENGENAGKIKLRACRGPAFIRDPVADAAGVGWIFAENWWTYRRPSCVTSPFAG